MLTWEKGLEAELRAVPQLTPLSCRHGLLGATLVDRVAKEEAVLARLEDQEVTQGSQVEAVMDQGTLTMTPMGCMW